METAYRSSGKYDRHLYNPLVWLFALWGGIQILLLSRYGIVTELEAEKYIYEAEHLLAKGTVSSPNYWLYSVQICLIILSIKLKLGFVFVYLVQLFFSGLSLYYFFRLVSGISNTATAFAISLLLALNIPYQTFNCQLQTESLFFSFTILLSCYVLRLTKLDIAATVRILLFLIVILFTRPTGLLFLPCVAIFLFFRFFSAYSVLLKSFIVIAVSFSFLYVLNKALGSGGQLDFMLPFRDERIICGVPTLPGFIPINTNDNPNSISGLLYYVTHNPDQFLRLAWLKTKSFFGATRPYYSSAHNLFLCILYFPLYIFSLLSISWWWNHNRNILLYCLSLIMITWLCVILTCDDWHNRFYLSIIPYFYILSVPAVKKLIHKLYSKHKQ